jgi:hypothetical protein
METATPLNAIGWITMIVSVTFVTVLTLWCFRRVLAGPKETPDPVKDFHSA